MSEMIERAVKAMDTAADTYLDNHAGCIWEDIPLEVFARAAIEAMREPTEAMLAPEVVSRTEARLDGTYPVNYLLPIMDIWPQMIDAALSEKP